MTPKQIEMLTWLAVNTMTSSYLNDSQKSERYKEIFKFLDMARDFYLIDEKKRAKIAQTIGDASMKAYKEYMKKEDIA